MAPKNQRAEEDNLSDTDSSRSNTPVDSGHKRIRIDKSISVGPSSRNSRKSKSSGFEEYKPGSIVRVSLKNFVTYDAVEFYPGPNLNMIIGPNGTGKSTIVCAIALGLGWNTSLLGRAKDISDFVKHGQDRSSIEIELKGKKTTVVITRTIKKCNNGSQWKLNGQITTHREIVNKVCSLNIQVDNLCQFLPQDKVSEFAQLSPPELLVQTQRAVGEQEMSEWHERLIKMREEEKALLMTTKDEEEQAENLEKRNAVLERDVARFKEREAILRRVELYELKIPFVRYSAAKNKYDEAKKIRNENHVTYQKLIKENAPMNEKKSELEAEGKDTFKEKKSCSEQFSKKKRQLDETANKLERFGNDCDDIRRNIINIRKKEKQRGSRISQLRTEIAELERLTAVEPTEEDDQSIRDQLNEISVQMRKNQMDGHDTKGRLDQLGYEEREVHSQITRVNQSRKELEDVRERRLECLRLEHHTLEAVQWIRQNRDKLVSRVFYPICVEINVRNARYAGAIENAIGQNYRTFVCENDQDYHTVTRELCDNRKLRINVVCFSNTTLNDFRPPIPNNQLGKFGFDCYLLDQVDAPATLLNALCNLSYLHKIPVALEEVNVNHKEIERNRVFNRYLVGDSSYSLSWSRYGKKLSQSFTTRLKPARILNNSINIEHRRRLERQFQELQENLTKIRSEQEVLIKEEEKSREEYEKLREKRNVLNEQKRQLQQVSREYQRNAIQLDSKRAQLERCLNSPDSIKEEENELREKLCEVAKKRARAVIRFQNLLEECMDLLDRRNRATLKYIKASSDLLDLENQTQQLDDALKQAQVNFKEADKSFNQAKSEAKRLWEVCKSKEIQQETRDEAEELCQNMTLEELEDAVTAERTKAEMHYAVDSRVIELYNKRKADIDSLRSKLEFKKTRLAKLTGDMITLREKWEPKLNALIKEISNAFSDSFDNIGCAGEVRVSPHEDFDKWGVDILVKFRDNEKLQVLNGQRQSGGERSVSTIMYLMSLQELAKTPFRVVDEINQGMDPRNERLVHGQMVQTACRPNTSQYFLITPKLLPDLEYHERMKILCIYNGEWQPEKMDWRKYMEDRKSSSN